MNEHITETLKALDAAGKLTAEELVARAADPKNPLHSSFEWDDTAAAHEYRLIQARRLIGSVYTWRASREAGEVRVPAYRYIPNVKRYVNIDDALTEHRDDLLAALQADAARLVKRYEQLESVVIVDAVTKATKAA